MGSVSHGAQGLVSQWKVAHSALSYLTLQATFFFQIILPVFICGKQLIAYVLNTLVLIMKFLRVYLVTWYACVCVCMCVFEHPFN